MKKKLLLLLIGIISFFIFPLPINAAETINANPGEVNIGGIVTITVSVPNSSDQIYSVSIQDDSSMGTNNFVRTGFGIDIRDKCTASKKNEPIVYSFDPERWDGDITCSPSSKADNYTITGKLKSDKIFPQGARDDVPYAFKAILSRPTDQSLTQVGVSSFSVVTQKPTATFNVDLISPEPAKPGEKITISLSNITIAGTYTALLGATGTIGQGACQPPGPCTLSATLPAKVDNEAVRIQVILQDPKGNRKTKDLQMTLPEGTNNTIPTSTIAPTLVPVSPPPCKDKNIGASGCASTDTAIGDLATDPSGFVSRVFTFLLGFSGGIAVLVFIAAGYKYMTSQGNPEGVKAAQEMIVSAVSGLLFVIFSYVILKVIGADILGIPGF